MTAPKFTIRLSRPEDAAEILRLKDETWLDAYPNAEHGISDGDIRSHLTKDSTADRLERWQGYLRPTDSMRNWVALKGTKIIGFVAASKGESNNEIKALYVLPNHQRQGAGSGLLAEAIAWIGEAKEVRLEVVAYNKPAIAAYEKAGFEINGSAKDDPFVLPSGAKMPQLEMLKKAQL